MDEEKKATYVEEIAELARQACEVKTVDGTPFVIVDGKVHSLAHLLKEPPRMRGTTTVTNITDYVKLINKIRPSYAPAIYGLASVGSNTISVVLNAGSGDRPDHEDHIARLSLVPSPEWKTWRDHDGKQMEQRTFAEFLEDNAPDIYRPEAAVMVELARTFQATSKVEFSSAIRLQNGQQQITYNEEISGTTSRGLIQIPEDFEIAVPIYEGFDAWKLTARLRYRLPSSGSDRKTLTVWYDLLNWERALRQQWKEIIDAVREKTAIPIFTCP